MTGNKNKKYMYIVFVIGLVMIIGLSLFQGTRFQGTQVKEGYTNSDDYGLGIVGNMLEGNYNKYRDSGNTSNFGSRIKMPGTIDLANSASESIDLAGSSVNSAMGSILSAIQTGHNTPAEPIWRDVYGSGEMTTPVPVIQTKPDTSMIVTDSCSTRGFLVSEYSEDICKKHNGDYKTINEKCSKLTEDNCKIPSCCVLLNGNKCAGGNAYGPTFLTEDGNQIDYNFYYYKGKCYGNCDMTSNDTLSACVNYQDNSTGVSKECMLQIFNSMGCPNANPSDIIDDDVVHSFSRSSRLYITNYLASAVKILKQNSSDDDSRVICYGPTKICDQYKNSDKNISTNCMVEMLTDANCPNKTVSAFTPQDLTKYSTYTKQNLQYAMNTCNQSNNMGAAPSTDAPPVVGAVVGAVWVPPRGNKQRLALFNHPKSSWHF
jgi:hypothetical protein